MAIVIAHRGASGYRPEHTLAAYALGARMGADYVEPDLVPTRDSVLVARHENEIGTTTDVGDRPEFAARRTTRTIDGVALTGWFTEDFTLAELKTLRAKERIPQIRPHNTLHDGRHGIPTLQEVIDLTRRLEEQLGRPIGIYPETKHPSYFRSIGLPLEEPLVETLRRNGLDGPRAKVFVQSFEAGSLEAVRRGLDVPLIQLLAPDAGLRDVSDCASGVGPAKALVSRAFVADAHAAGLLVHPYTFRNENAFLPLELRRGTPPDPAQHGDAFAEYAHFLELGVDGLFSDHPDTAVEARDGGER